ncbi:MAG: NHLP family bacteriocin export ABC transporter peptidase/permease/ATPase subunit [Blautia sp.]|nr:NHLP family bacteriocin export ABC transporter peptidase/permease/ATPase subunit [Blautia sp.]
MSRKNGIRQPLSKGAARVPVIMQMEALECSAACLAMVLAYYDKWIPLEQVRLDCGISRNGSNARNLLLAARSYGLEADAYRIDLEVLKEHAIYPCIVHWEFNHFVVLAGFSGNKAVINDPARGSLRLSMDEFDRAYTGVCLLFSPGENFVPDGRPRSTLSYIRKRLSHAGSALVFAGLTALISSLFGVFSPVMSRVFFDRILTGQSPGWLFPFFLLLAMLSLAWLAVEWIRTVFSKKLYGKMSVIGTTSYMWKLLCLPMDFFSQRMTGDLLQRQATAVTVSRTLTETVLPLVLHTVMMVFYLALMLHYSLILTFAGLACVFLNLLTAACLSRMRLNLTRIQLRDRSKLSSATLSGMNMAETIKASGAENGFFRLWSGYQAALNAKEAAFSDISTRLEILPAFFSRAANYLVLFLGIRYAMDGSFTLGMIVAFQGFLNAFMSPASELIDAGRSVQEMRTQLEKIEDVMNYPNDPSLRNTGIREDVDYSKLRGQVELRHITFGYSRLAPPVVKDFSMTLTPGSRVAIVGGSGSGKSTISKLIAGLYQPWEGEILIEGNPIGEIPREVLSGSLAVVDQEIILFEDTVANNIRMWDETIEDFEVILAARDAQLHDDIIQRPGGYQGMIAENGRDLSGGQRQRMEIARVLAQDPSIIILDEATSALDAKTEYDVVKAIQDRGITCIVIAHRLSTIRNCDEILVLDKGQVAEHGTHEELLQKGGIYADLIANS